MKIVKYGKVILEQGTVPRIEGWLMMPEIEDPPDASPEQLVAAVAAEWALKHLQAVYSGAVLDGLIQAGKKIKKEPS
jgi:hypothetical protein